MQVYVANSSSQKIGGGWSFIDNFKKALGALITDDYAKANVYFISGATMVSREEVNRAKSDNKKIVLRVDNAVRNSRNRNTGMSRLYDFAQMADLVIFQSHWARQVIGEQFLGVKGKVIINGCDLDLFRNKRGAKNNFLYTRYNRDETKNWEMARFIFQEISQASKVKPTLGIVGNFSQELIDGNFDFYMGENYNFYGVQNKEQMADIYCNHQYLIYTYFNDACSNTLIEALCSGMQIYDPYNMRFTGGSYEILQKFGEKKRKYFSLYRMGKEYEKALKKL